VALNCKSKRGQNRGKIGTCSFGRHSHKTNIFQGAELRGCRGGTPKSGGLAGSQGSTPHNRQSREEGHGRAGRGTPSPSFLRAPQRVPCVVGAAPDATVRAGHGRTRPCGPDMPRVGTRHTRPPLAGEKRGRGARRAHIQGGERHGRCGSMPTCGDLTGVAGCVSNNRQSRGEGRESAGRGVSSPLFPARRSACPVWCPSVILLA